MKTRFYSFILKNVILPIGDVIMKTDISGYYNKIKKMELWQEEEIQQWQNEKLKQIIYHAYDNTIYYKELFDEIGLKPHEIKSKVDLKRIPILTKDIIRIQGDKMIAKNIDSIPFISNSTGGSTGDPMKFLLDKKSWSYSNANSKVNWEKTGFRFGDKYIALGSTSLFVNKSISLKHRVYYLLKNKISLSGIDMSDDICGTYIDLIKKEKIKFIYGYASSIFLLARYIKLNKLELKIEACFPTSEVLTDLYRNTIMDAFNCKVVNCYGAHDGGITAFQTNKGNFNVGYNSIVRLDESLDSSFLEGPALLTDLLNYAMPMINYQLGDEIRLNREKGDYNGQEIEKVYGRTSEIIKFKNGKTLTGPGFTILFKDLPVKAYRIVKLNENTLLCEIIKLKHFNELHEKLIFSTFEKHLGEECKIELVYKKSFPRTSNGKREYFFSN